MQIKAMTLKEKCNKKAGDEYYKVFSRQLFYYTFREILSIKKQEPF